MLEFFTTYTETYHNGILVGSSSSLNLGLKEEQEIISEQHFKLTWENLDEMKRMVPFTNFATFDFKKGRLISFDMWNPFNKNKRDIKEWKTALNVEIILYQKIIKPSLKSLLNYGDTAQVLTYMQQHNLKI